jgi:hypothetical protein
MGIKAILDSLDDVQEELKPLYKETEGKFVLDVDGIDDHPKVRGVITANRENAKKRDQHKAEVEALKKRLEGLPEDFDVNAFEELRAAADGKGGAPTEEQIAEIREKIRSKLEPKYTEPLAKKDEEIKGLRGAIERMTVDGGLSAAMDAAHIAPEHKAKLLPYLKSQGRIKVEEEEGQFKALVETDMGNVSLQQYVTDWASSEDGKIYVAKSTGPGARGGKAGGGTGKAMSRSQFDAMPAADRSAFITEGGQVTE